MLKRFTPLVAIAAAFALGACSDDDPVGIDEIAPVRIVNAASATTNLDVRVNDELLLGNVAFGSGAAACQDVPAGTQEFVFRSSGSTTDLGTLTSALAVNTPYTLVFAGPNSIELLTDDAAAPAAATARVRFVNVSGGAIDVHATAPGSNAFGATPTAANIAIDGSSAFIDFPRTNNRIRVTTAGTTTVLLDIPSLTIPAGGVLNVIVTRSAAGAYQFIAVEPCA